VSKIALYLLGQPRLEVDGALVAVNTRKAIALIAYLAVTGQNHSREALDALLWPDSTPRKARAALRTTLSILKKALNDEWQFFQAEALRRDLATALEQLVICLKTREDYETAIGHARRWLSLDPLHEPAHCQLMELYALTGQHSAALRQYQECVRLLKEELGLPPQDETTALYQRLRLGTESRHLIANRYTCRRLESDLLGQGSTGQVYREIDTETGQAVAVKILKPEFVIQQPDLVERFNREGEALRQLNHPNIIKLLATAEEEGQQFLVMEYATGGSLRDLLKRETPLPLDRVLQIAIELSDALTQTHYRSIIHRDLKPGNVLLDQDGTPRLTDFGVAHLAQAERLTQTGMAIGTLDYLAPEALSGERVDARGDIWSLGVLLFEMLAQQRPFPGHTPTEVLTAILTQPTPDLATLRPDLPPALVSLVSRMLVKDPVERIASARLVGAELEAIVQGRKGIEELGRMGGSVVSPFPPHPPAPQPPSNLPAQTTPFIGRERELTELTRLLTDSACRLVTLSGPGGIGKTRLAIKAAQNFIDASPDKPIFSHGFYFVLLEMVSSPGFLVSAIADAIGFVFYSDIDLRQQLLDYLREKEMLLILDNFEHLLEGVDLLTDILTTAPAVKLLVTSIETLNLHEEWYYPLEGLTFPEDETIDQAALDEYSAVQLFVQSAQRAQPGFSLSSERDCVIRICRLVEGVPLGIELAVVWLKAFTCERIAQEIERSIDFLATTQRNVPGRHQSIRAIFEYSWQLLSENEKSILRRLSVFGGGFRAEAAQQISGASLAILMALVEKSLLRPSPGERYQMPKLLKQFTAEKLEAVPQESAKTQDRHSDYYLNFLHQRKEAITGKHRRVALMELGEEIENIQVAWNRAIEQGQVAMINQVLPSFYTLCKTRSWFWEGQEAFEKAAQYLQSRSQEPGSEAILGRLQARLGTFCLSVGQFEAAKKLLQESLAIANQLSNASEIAFSLNFLGQVTEMQGNVTEAKHLFLQGLVNSQEAGDQAAVAIFLKNLGSISITYLGTYQEASRYLKESLAISRELERQDLVSDCLHTLGYTYTLLGEYARAEPYCRESLAIFDEVGDRIGKAMAIGGLGLVAEGLGGDRLIEAKSYFEERVALCREIGARFFIAGSLATLGRINNGLGAYHEAIDCSQEALAIAKEIGNPRKTTEALSALGEAASGLGDHQRAKQHLREGLQIAIEPGAIPYLLEALGILAAIFTAENGLTGEEGVIYAVELLTMVIHHPASWDIVKQKAARHLADIEVELPRDLIAAAKARGQTRDLQETVTELLEALANPD
jgi:serine/threonine protein kinase/DNA-binding SARP family transcriptional activator